MACSSAPPKANQHAVVDYWRPQVGFYHGRRASGVDAVRVYYGRRAFGVDEALSTSVWCRRGACLSWSKSVWCRRGAFIGVDGSPLPEANQHAVVDSWRPVWVVLALLLACTSGAPTTPTPPPPPPAPSKKMLRKGARRGVRRSASDTIDLLSRRHFAFELHYSAAATAKQPESAALSRRAAQRRDKSQIK